jgi:hypothetical protein
VFFSAVTLSMPCNDVSNGVPNENFLAQSLSQKPKLLLFQWFLEGLIKEGVS